MAHFVIDAGLWRMRDPFPRRFMAQYLPFLVPPGQRDTTLVPVTDGSSTDIVMSAMARGAPGNAPEPGPDDRAARLLRPLTPARPH